MGTEGLMICGDPDSSLSLFIYLFCQRVNESMYHALGYSTIMYLQAMMTFEPVRISWLFIKIATFFLVCFGSKRKYISSCHLHLLVIEPVVYSIQVVIFSQCFIKIAVIDDLNNNAITLKYQCWNLQSVLHDVITGMCF